MKKAIIALAIVFVISLMTAIVSFAICGGELIKTGIDYAIEQYEEYEEDMEQYDEVVDD